MLRFFGAAVFLLTMVMAASVSAGERYVEIWNPPEARIGAPPVKCAPKTRGATVTSRNAGKVVPRRVADPLSRSMSGKRAPVSIVKKPSVSPSVEPPISPSSPSLYIPRVITPEGNVFRV